MSDRQLQFRVGLFVLTAMAIGVGLTFQFGNLNSFFEPRYLVGIEFDDLSGVHPGTPVRQSGIPIGEVKDVSVDRKKQKVLVVVEILERYPLAQDARPQLVQSLLGEAHIDFSLGTSQERLDAGALLTGEMPQDPFAAVERLEKQVTKTLQVFAETSNEWKAVGHNVNTLIVTNQGSLDDVVEKAALALTELTTTMRKASETLDQTNQFVSDPEMQGAVKDAMTALPKLIQQTEQTVATTQQAVSTLGQTMENLRVATGPLAENSGQLTTKLDASLGQLSRTLAQLEKFSTQLNEGDGSIQRLASDPQLYRNLQLSSASLAALLSNLDPIVSDMRVFSDKVARHPELLGVSGYLKGSTGLKDLPQPQSPTAPAALRARQAGFSETESSGNSMNLRSKR